MLLNPSISKRSLKKILVFFYKSNKIFEIFKNLIIILGKC